MPAGLEFQPVGLHTILEKDLASDGKPGQGTGTAQLNCATDIMASTGNGDGSASHVGDCASGYPLVPQ